MILLEGMKSVGKTSSYNSVKVYPNELMKSFTKYNHKHIVIPI